MEIITYWIRNERGSNTYIRLWFTFFLSICFIKSYCYLLEANRLSIDRKDIRAYFIIIKKGKDAITNCSACNCRWAPASTQEMLSTEEAGVKKKRRTSFFKKGVVSTHIDPAMKNATVDSGDVGDATQYVTSMEKIVIYIGRSEKQLRQMLIALPAIPEPVSPAPE